MILVTGGSGYIGSALCEKLRELALEHNILTRKPYADNCIEFDLLNGEERELSDIVNSHTHIIHCAWFVDRHEYLHSTQNFRWVEATMRLASMADARKVKHFNAIGTCLEYAPTDQPKKVSSELGATSIYAASKIATQTGLRQLLSLKQIKFSWSRIFHIFGGNEHSDRLVPTINRCVSQREPYSFNAASQIIDLTPISNVANDLVNISMEEKQGDFNLCSGKAKTIFEIVNEIAGEDAARELFTFSDDSFSGNNLAGIRCV